MTVLEVTLDQFKIAEEDDGGGVSHEVHEGNYVHAVAEALQGEGAAKVMQTGFGDAGELGTAAHDLAQA